MWFWELYPGPRSGTGFPQCLRRGEIGRTMDFSAVKRIRISQGRQYSWLMSAILKRAIGLLVLTGMMTGLLAAEAPTSELSAQEEAFQKRLEKVLFEGQWCLVKDGVLGPWKTDKYTIQSANKVSGDDWVITSRIQFGSVDVNLPLTVQVYWAGDTPVISVTDLPVPGAGTYTARVLVYENTYAGSWFGKGYGGQMTGTIKPQ